MEVPRETRAAAAPENAALRRQPNRSFGRNEHRRNSQQGNPAAPVLRAQVIRRRLLRKQRNSPPRRRNGVRTKTVLFAFANPSASAHRSQLDARDV
jgi:hypothetical protein